jgi:hypothetical protein
MAQGINGVNSFEIVAALGPMIGCELGGTKHEVG